MRDTVNYTDNERHPGGLISFEKHPEYLECIGEGHFALRVYVINECLRMFNPYP